MSWVAYIPAAISAVSAISQSSQTASGTANQAQWQKFDSQRRYDSAMTNLQAQRYIAAANAKSVQAGAKVKAELIENEALFNVGMIEATTNYNSSLLDYEEELLWEQMDLDLSLLERQRARERGSIKAQQSASGTVMGEGSNAEVIIDQKTQEALDSFVVRRNADIAARKISNKQAQSEWQGQMAIQKTLWQGQLQQASAFSQASGQAASIIAQSNISAAAGKISAGFARDSAWHGARNTQQAGKDASWNQLTTGLFSAAAQGAQAYYQNEGRSLMED